MITPFEYHQSLKHNEMVGYTEHLGIKETVNEEVSIFAFISSPKQEKSSINYELSEEFHPLKGINKAIFINNEDFSNYYESNYNFDEFPKFVKNYAQELISNGENKNEVKKIIVNKIFLAFKHSLYKNLNNKNEKMSSELLYAIKSQYSINYCEFNYPNTFLSSSLGILPIPLSRFFLHICNQKTIIKDLKTNHYKFNKIYDSKKVVLSEDGTKIIKEEELIKDLIDFDIKIKSIGHVDDLTKEIMWNSWFL